MEEVLRPYMEVIYPVDSQLEPKKPRAIDQVFIKFDADFDAAVLDNEDDDELTFALRCVRDNFVSEGLVVAQTVDDCDRISMKLGSNNEGLKKQIQHRSDFLSVVNRFDKEHKAILTRVPSLDEDIESIESDELRFKELPKALIIANSKFECSEILGRIPERQACLRDLVTRKMASL